MTKTRRICLTVMLLAGAVGADAMNIYDLWDYAKPAESEARLRAALAGANHDLRLELRTQIARTYSLRRRFDEAHRLLDEIEPQLAQAGLKPRLRYLLERGRTFNSAGQKEQARPLFTEAWERASAAREEDLAIDAAHMIAIVDGGAQALEWNRIALKWAADAKDPSARRWRASLLHNIGYELKTLGRLDEALEHFRRAVPAYEERGEPRRVREAHWMVAHTLRLLKRRDEALAIQLRLEQESAGAGESDGYVFEELAELYDALGQTARAQRYFQRAAAELGKDPWFVANEPERLARLQKRAMAP